MAEPVAKDPEVGLRAPNLMWVLGLVAVVLLPGLGRIVGERPHSARLELAGVMTLIVAGCALLLLAALFYGSGRRLRWSLGVTTITTLVLFHWPNLTRGSDLLVETVPVGILRDVVPVAFAGALLWLAVRRADEPGFAIASGIAVWAMAVLLLVVATPYMTNPLLTPQPAEPTPNSPDAILIILDGYPRADVLANGFAFDNSQFLSGLEDRGFYIADAARPNYSYTLASVSSMFAMDYLFDLGPVDPNEEAAMRRSLSGNSRLVDQFHDRGYKVTFLENAWEGSHCGPSIDRCIRDGILERSLWNVGQLTILAPIFKALRPDPFASVSLSHLENLADTVADSQPGTPSLTIAHVLLPHQPNLVDDECKIDNSTERRRKPRNVEELETVHQHKREQISCINRQVLEQLDRIVAANEETVVMITGDHGMTSTVVADTRLETHSTQSATEQMSILSAYRLPGCEGLTYPTITPVNGVRAMTACALGVEVKLLPDVSSWINVHGERMIVSLEGILPPYPTSQSPDDE